MFKRAVLELVTLDFDRDRPPVVIAARERLGLRRRRISEGRVGRARSYVIVLETRDRRRADRRRGVAEVLVRVEEVYVEVGALQRRHRQVGCIRAGVGRSRGAGIRALRDRV